VLSRTLQKIWTSYTAVYDHLNRAGSCQIDSVGNYNDRIAPVYLLDILPQDLMTRPSDLTAKQILSVSSVLIQ
jgi:hypothetical protein